MHFEKDPPNLPSQSSSHPGPLPPLPFYHNGGALPASPFQRLLAFAVDFTIFLIFWFSGTALYHHFNNELLGRIGPKGDPRSVAGETLLLLLVFSLFIFAGYALYYTFTFGQGQTLGGRVANLRFIRQSGESPGYVCGFFRYGCQLLLYGLIFFWGYLGYIEPFFIRLLNGEKYYGLVDKPPIIAGVLLTGLIWSLPHLTMLFNRKSQSGYDIMFQVLAVKTRGTAPYNRA